MKIPKTLAFITILLAISTALAATATYLFSRRGIHRPPASPARPLLTPHDRTVLVDVHQLLGRQLGYAVATLGPAYTVSVARNLYGTGTRYTWDSSNFVVFAETLSADQPIDHAALLFKSPRPIDNASALHSFGIAVDYQYLRSLDANGLRTELGVYPWMDDLGKITVDHDIKVGFPAGAITGVEVTSQDAERIRILRAVANDLDSRLKSRTKLPSTNNRSLAWDQDSIDQPIHIGLFPDTPDYRHSYRSSWAPPPGTPPFTYRSDGQDYYELTTLLANSRHPQCVLEATGCLYRIRNGQVVSTTEP